MLGNGDEDAIQAKSITPLLWPDNKPTRQCLDGQSRPNNQDGRTKPASVEVLAVITFVAGRIDHVRGEFQRRTLHCRQVSKRSQPTPTACLKQRGETTFGIHLLRVPTPHTVRSPSGRTLPTQRGSSLFHPEQRGTIRYIWQHQPSVLATLDSFQQAHPA